MFTLNNPNDAERQFWTDMLSEGMKDVRFVILQEERGEEGTVHFQGYIELDKALTLNGVKRRFGKRLHVEPRRGTQAQAIAYCKKAESRVENGLSGASIRGWKLLKILSLK